MSDPNGQSIEPEPAVESAVNPESDVVPASTPKPPPPPNPLRELGRYLYNSNPFYVLSAILILVGLHLLCNDEAVLADTNSVAAAGWTHLALLAGYTVLLAGAGIVVVRVAGVWEDARTILLSVLLLLVAMSVEFDHLLLTRPTAAKAVLSVGALFALLLVEATIRGVQVRLPAGYRVPLFAGLALFFLYPVLVLTVLDQVGYANNGLGREGTKWLVFLFPAAAGLVALTLLPAAARGRNYVAENGTPWRWPWFPWPVFVFLAVGVCFRAYYMTLSFDPQPKMQSAFGFYYLTPFVLAVAAVVFEAGRSSKSVGAQAVALVAPLSLLLLALPVADSEVLLSPPFRMMLEAHLQVLGPPIRIACYGLLALYGYSVLRGVGAAWVGVAGLLIVAAFIGPQTIGFHSFAAKPAIAPLAVLTACAIALILISPRNSPRWMLLAVSLLGVVLSVAPGDSLNGVQLGASVVVLCGVAVLLGALFKDVFAEIVAEWGAVGLLVASYYIAFSGSDAAQSAQANGAALGFGILAAAIQFLNARRSGSEFGWSLGWLSLIPVGTRTVAHAVALLRLLRNPLPVALVLGGAASFVLGAAITAVKAGWRPFRKKADEAAPSTPPDEPTSP